VKGQLVAVVLNSQHAETGATWRISTKIWSTCRRRRHIVSPRAQLVFADLLSRIKKAVNGISIKFPGWKMVLGHGYDD